MNEATTGRSILTADAAISPALLQRARGGDTAALEEMVTRLYPVVRRWAYVHTGDAVDADDLTQDVLVQIVERLPTYRGDAAFGTWVWSVTRNAATDAGRKRTRRARILDRGEADALVRPSPPPDPAAAAEARWTARLLGAFLGELPERQRQVLDMADLQGMTSPEIGDRLGIAPASVRVHLLRARRALRAWILDHHPDLVPEESP